MSPLLEARGLARAFGGVRAVDGVDLTLQPGEIHALIGPNGAGKTTLVSLLSGRIAPDEGQIWLDGQDITRLSATRRVKAGIGYTFQITSVFAGLSLRDNIALALEGGRAPKRDPEGQINMILTRFGLQDLAETMAGDLSYGHQRVVEMAMGLALAPRLLILDEPTQGLAADDTEAFKALARSLVPEVTLLLIEHNMEVVMQIATRISVLAAGRIIATGTPEEIRANALVQEAYLGQ